MCDRDDQPILSGLGVHPRISALTMSGMPSVPPVLLTLHLWRDSVQIPGSQQSGSLLPGTIQLS